MKLKDIPKRVGEIDINTNKIKRKLGIFDNFLISFGKICTILILIFLIIFVIFNLLS